MASTDRPFPAGRTPASTHFAFADAELRADGVALTSIAERFGTPSYVYSGASIDAAYDTVDRSLGAQPHVIAYAMKANGNLAILARLARRGASVDIVSGGELARALRAGFAPERILFSGIGKTDAEIRTAIDAGVRSLHAESEPEIDAIEAIASALGKPAPLALRVNPDVDASTHPYIATGLSSSKFGVSLDVARRLLPRILKSKHLRLEGIACHVGSRVLSPDPIAEAVEITARFARQCEEQGARIASLDAGGGWPIEYGDESKTPAALTAFGNSITEAMRRGAGGDRGWQLVIEPGRSIVGDAGVLLTRVLFVKEQSGKRFVIVDAAMTELIRPALYEAFHAVVPVREPARDALLSPADVVGPVCESSDFLARGRPLPPLQRGDLLAIRGAGAYAASMGSRYNGRPLAAEVLVDGGEAKLVRKREPLDALWREDVLD
jgi:diaminopimelate decarboxylase